LVKKRLAGLEKRETIVRHKGYDMITRTTTWVIAGTVLILLLTSTGNSSPAESSHDGSGSSAFLILQTILTAVTFVMVLVLAWHAYEMRRATRTQAFCSLLDRLQSEQVRAARRAVIKEHEFEKSKGCPVDWLNNGLTRKAEIVCHTYDAAGIMVRNGMVDKKLLVDNWGHSIKKCWAALEPLVIHYRTHWPAPKVWNDFEALAEMCEE